MNEPLDPAKLTPETLAHLLSASLKRRSITTENVSEIAEAGNLLSTDGTINLVMYTAYLLSEKYHDDTN